MFYLTQRARGGAEFHRERAELQIAYLQTSHHFRIKMQKLNRYFFLILLAISSTLMAQNTLMTKQQAIELLKSHANELKGVDQLILSVTDGVRATGASLFAFEKKGNGWTLISGPIKAVVGRSGMAAVGEKVEGDGKSPSGLFELGKLFSYEEKVDTKLKHQKVDAEDKWIDDVNSAQYNMYVRGATTATTFEHLLLKSIDYKYCMVIEYNTKPVVKGKGSAIFFHLADEKFTPTAGCVAIKEAEMLAILKWMRPDSKRFIWMGTKEDLGRRK
jgi:L,D-peptidoglycan transpeptidase YkuD (ErfK/YbiS/YcfS/YnhG family)